MTNEDIKKIANKIARSFVHPDDHTPYGEQTYRQVEAVITQLSKDYAIVPKSVLKERYKESELRSVSPLRFDSLTGIARLTLIEAIFGAEMFEEEF